jgi:hypothetical protein
MPTTVSYFDAVEGSEEMLPPLKTACIDVSDRVMLSSEMMKHKKKMVAVKVIWDLRVNLVRQLCCGIEANKG